MKSESHKNERRISLAAFRFVLPVVIEEKQKEMEIQTTRTTTLTETLKIQKIATCNSIQNMQQKVNELTDVRTSEAEIFNRDISVGRHSRPSILESEKSSELRKFCNEENFSCSNYSIRNPTSTVDPMTTSIPPTVIGTPSRALSDKDPALRTRGICSIFINIKKFAWDDDDNFRIIFGCLFMIFTIGFLSHYPIICFIVGLVALGGISSAISSKCYWALRRNDPSTFKEDIRTELPAVLAYYQSTHCRSDNRKKRKRKRNPDDSSDDSDNYTTATEEENDDDLKDQIRTVKDRKTSVNTVTCCKAPVLDVRSLNIPTGQIIINEGLTKKRSSLKNIFGFGGHRPDKD